MHDKVKYFYTKAGITYGSQEVLNYTIYKVPNIVKNRTMNISECLCVYMKEGP